MRTPTLYRQNLNPFFAKVPRIIEKILAATTRSSQDLSDWGASSR